MRAIIGYPGLTDDKRNKILETFFDKMIEDTKSDTKKGGRKRRIKVSRLAKGYLLSHEEVKTVKWNGREIRNSFQTAVALAEYDALHESDREESDPINVELLHFQDIVKLSTKVRKYMERFGDDAKRAIQAKTRNDYKIPSSR
jgi:ribosomal protein L17